jgi:hypothetical protein
VTASELTLLRDRRARKHTIRQLVAKAGPQAEWGLRQLQREQVKLALVSSGVDSPDDARLLQQRSVARAQRARLLTAPGAPEALGFSADQAATEITAASTFTPDRTVGPNGAWAWTTPDLADKRRMGLPASLPLQTVEQRGDWVLVRGRDSWYGWTGATYLVPFAGTPLGGPPPG